MRRHSIAPIAAAVLLALAGSAQAATVTTNFDVTATVASNCLVSATDLNFGSYTGVAALPGTSNVAVNCTNGLGYTVMLSAGGGTYANRLMASGVDKLEYNLYTAGSYSAIWGDGSPGTSVVTGTGTGLGSTLNHTVYGYLANSALNQAAPAGSYADQITVTVEY